MNKLTQAFIMLGALAGAVPALAQTQPTAATPPTVPPANAAAKPAAPAPTWADELKKPTDWFSWGADLRLRNEYYDNIVTLDENADYHQQDYFRFRGRVWASLATLEKTLSLNARLTAEPRYYVKDAGSPAHMRGHHGMDWQEGIIDNLNVKWAKAFEQPLTLTVGRQDMKFGDGWLVMDGTPLDGSRTLFLDAARATWEMKEQNTTIDLVYIEMSAMNNAWLPTLTIDHESNTQPRALTDQDERGAILYVSNKSMKSMNVDAYFIYKYDHDLATTGKGDLANIYTPGVRFSGELSDHWKYRAEGALQFGDKTEINKDYAYANQEEDIMAYGLNSRLTYMVKDSINNQFHFDFEYLSGDDPSTEDNEAFDVLWGRWPRFSEAYVYNYGQETRPGQLSNLIRFGPAWTLSPTKKMDLNFAYNLLYADERDPALSNAAVFSNEDSFRGHFVQGFMKYNFCKNASGHLWAEYLAPGEFYTHQPAHVFLRAEVMFTF